MNELEHLKIENEQLKAKILILEEVAYNVPLCAGHAQIWSTERHFEPDICWFCQLLPNGEITKPEITFEYIN